MRDFLCLFRCDIVNIIIRCGCSWVGKLQVAESQFKKPTSLFQYNIEDLLK